MLMAQVTRLRITVTFSSESNCAGCHKQNMWTLDSNTLIQQNPSVLTWCCQLPDVDLYDEQKAAVLVVVSVQA